MPLKKKPVTGMKDILPAEMQIRDYVTGLIKETYKSFGFSPIETPCVEHIENLCSKQGGDNEKLIFKIMKRGEKLNLETAQSEADLTDSGLRYDLTLPLSRFYSNNANNLPTPFKALQIGSVWRADRPQRGRFRQFVQCDICLLYTSYYTSEGAYLSGRVPEVGETIWIKYNPDKPKQSYIPGYDNKVYKILTIVFGLIGAVPILVCIGIATVSYTHLGIALRVRYHGAGRCSRSVPCWQMHGIPKHGCKQAGLHPENAPVYGGRTYDLLPASAVPVTVPDRSGASRSD